MARKKQLAAETAGADAGPDLDPHWVGQIQDALVAWFQDSARDLPWRKDRDPYRVLVSEMMLVQTTVAAVVPYFERFLAQFPTVQDLARAEADQVLKAWEGLGYYRRARQLHDAARAIVEQHQGAMPTTIDEVRSLPGVGPYIAGAILSFALDRPAPILEANTQRVAARWLAWREEIRSTKTQSRLWRLAERVVPTQNPGAFNQAFMELGATVCTVKAPLCLVCPVASFCAARTLGLQDEIPVVAPKAPAKEVHEACGVIRDESGRFLLVRRAPGQLWERFWEFPTVHLSGANPAGRELHPGESLEWRIERLTGVLCRLEPVAKRIRYAVTTHKVMLDAHPGRSCGGTPRPGHGMTETAWLTRDELAGKTLGSASRRVAKALTDPS